MKLPGRDGETYMAKILSIEIGSSLTRVAEMDYKVKNPKVYKLFSFATPDGVTEDGFVQESPDFIAALKGALGANKVKTKNVVFSVTSSKIVTREVVIPGIKTNQLETFISANANDYFPIDLSMYEIAHVLLGTDKTEDGKEKHRVLVMAAGKDLIAGYLKLASSCGLKLACIDYVGNSVYQVIKNECGLEPTLVVRVEDNTTVASVIVNGSMSLQRNLAYGVERAVKAVVDSSEYYENDYASAQKVLCAKPCLKVALNDRTRILERDEAPFESDKMEEARTKVTATFTQLIGNLVRVIELYNSKDPANRIQKVVLTGIGAEFQNLSKLFTNEIGIPTTVLKDVRSVGTLSVGAENVGRYIAVFGAAIEPVGLMTDIKQKEKKVINYGLYTVIALIVIVAALAGIFLKAFLPNQAAKEEEANLLAQEQQYAEAEVVHKQFVAVEELYNDMDLKFAMTEHPNDGLLAFLTELEEKLPSDVALVSFSSNNKSTGMVIHVADYNEAAKVLQILRTFDSLKSVTTSGVSMPKKDYTNTDNKASNSEEETPEGFDFEVICEYYPSGSSAE